MAEEISIGSSAFWCPETPNYIVGVSAELCIVAGHSRTFVWAMPGGEPIAVWTRRDLRRSVAIARDGDHVLVDTPDHRLRLALATGDTVAEEPPVPAAQVAIDNLRTTMTLTLPGVAPVARTVPWTRTGCVARDGGRYALDGTGGKAGAFRVRVHDTATHALVHEAARSGTPALSADGRYLVVSLLGPPRIQVVDVDRGAAITPALPPGIHTVTLGHPSLVVVDDGVWSLEPTAGGGAPERIATVGAWGQREIRGDHIVGAASGLVGRWRLRDGERDAAVELGARGVYTASTDGAGRFVALTLDDSHGLLAVFPDGVWLADLGAGAGDPTSLVRVSDGPGPAVVALAPAADAIAVISWGEHLRVVDRGGVELLRPVLPVEPTWSRFSPDGRRLLVVGDVRTEDDRLEGRDGVETAWIVERDGAVRTLGAGTWRGWLGGELVRRAGARLERVDAETGAVRAVAAVVEDNPTRVWFDERRVALAANDGRLRIRDLVWSPVA